MNKLYIEKTKETPEINFNQSTGILKISGRAYSNDIYQFYNEFIIWVDQYLMNPKETTTIEIQIEYCNTIFNKLLIKLLEKSKIVLEKNRGLVIKWYYEKDDKDSYEDALFISKTIEFPIEGIEL